MYAEVLGREIMYAIASTKGWTDRAKDDDQTWQHFSGIVAGVALAQHDRENTKHGRAAKVPCLFCDQQQGRATMTDARNKQQGVRW